MVELLWRSPSLFASGKGGGSRAPTGGRGPDSISLPAEAKAEAEKCARGLRASAKVAQSTYNHGGLTLEGQRDARARYDEAEARFFGAAAQELMAQARVRSLSSKRSTRRRPAWAKRNHARLRGHRRSLRGAGGRATGGPREARVAGNGLAFFYYLLRVEAAVEVPPLDDVKGEATTRRSKSDAGQASRRQSARNRFAGASTWRRIPLPREDRFVLGRPARSTRGAFASRATSCGGIRPVPGRAGIRRRLRALIKSPQAAAV